MRLRLSPEVILEEDERGCVLELMEQVIVDVPGGFREPIQEPACVESLLRCQCAAWCLVCPTGLIISQDLVDRVR